MDAEWRNALPVGTEADACRIERVLGAGGFGITYLATDLQLDRRVAVKEYLPTSLAERAPDGQTVRPLNTGSEETFKFGLERFRAEAQTLARFSHPNIVGVQRYFEANGTAYLVMSYEDGLSLSDIMARHGALTEDELREILDPLLDGLAKVHAAGFLHRDIKPGNIYIRRDGSPVLLDFGAARQALSERSQSLTIIATPGYAPFEQYSSRGNQGPWTDIYALGATVYRAITGVMPPDALSRIHGEEMVPATREAMGPYDRRFLEAVDAALALQPEDRPQSVGAWRAMLSAGRDVAAEAGEPTLHAGGAALFAEAARAAEDRKSGGHTEAAAARRGRRVAWAAAAAFALVAAGGGAYGYHAYQQAQEEARLAAEAESRRAAEAARQRLAVRAASWAGNALDRAEEEARRRRRDELARQRALALDRQEQARREAEARKKAEEERRRRIEEDLRRKIEAAQKEAERKAQKEAERKAQEEAERKAAEKARKKAEEEARKKAEEADRKARQLALATPTSNPSEIAAIQRELTRLGCGPLGADGAWGANSAKALERYNRYAQEGQKGSVPSKTLLNILQGIAGLVCPLSCRTGYVPRAGRCVALPCPAGQVRLRNGICRARAAPRRRQARSRGTITPMSRQFRRGNQTCRRFSESTKTADGRTKVWNGVVCQTPDGSWHIQGN